MQLLRGKPRGSSSKIHTTCVRQIAYHNFCRVHFSSQYTLSTFWNRTPQFKNLLHFFPPQNSGLEETDLLLDLSLIRNLLVIDPLCRLRIKIPKYKIRFLPAATFLFSAHFSRNLVSLLTPFFRALPRLASIQENARIQKLPSGLYTKHIHLNGTISKRYHSLDPDFVSYIYVKLFRPTRVEFPSLLVEGRFYPPAC